MPTPDRTSLSEIVAAAAALLEAGGPRAVTMQAVAARVGVRAPSLYKRVRDRDALLVLTAEAAADDLTARLLASAGGLDGIARAYRAFATERPQSFRLLFAVEDAAEAFTRASEPLLAVTRELVGEDHALDAARLVTAWATGFLYMELAGAFRLGGDIDAAFDYGLAQLEASLATRAHPRSRT